MNQIIDKIKIIGRPSVGQKIIGRASGGPQKFSELWAGRAFVYEKRKFGPPAHLCCPWIYVGSENSYQNGVTQVAQFGVQIILDS